METVQSIRYKMDQVGSPNLINKTNIGTVGSGVVATEYGNAHMHTTILTIKQLAAFTLADNAAKGVGSLIYTFPAGALYVNNAYMALKVTNAEHIANNAAELGLGMTVATGAVSVLSGNAGFENILTGLATYELGTIGISQDICNSTAGTGGLRVNVGNPHDVFANIASTWANTAGLSLNADLEGTVILNWTFLI
jgi:hypothetical protein